MKHYANTTASVIASFNATMDASNSSATSRDTDGFVSVMRYIELYVTPVIIIVGLIGNTLSFLVFVCTHLRRLSSSVYLAALAVTDTGFLVQLFISWLGHVRIYTIHQQGWCHAVIYMSYVCGFLSVWLVVSFTVERYIAVCYPLRRQDMCTVRRARIVVLILASIGIVAYSFAIWTTGLIANGSAPFPLCKVYPIYVNLVNNINNIDTVITLLIPSLTIFTMNVHIVYKIAYFYDQREQMTAHKTHLGTRTSTASDEYHVDNHQSKTTLLNTIHPDTGENSHTQHHHLPQNKKKAAKCTPEHQIRTSATTPSSTTHQRNRAQIKITKLLLVVSTVFLILNLPSHAIRIYYFFNGLTNHVLSKDTELLFSKLQAVFTLMFNLNFSINFFLYSLCGKNFRTALYRLWLRLRYAMAGLVQSKYHQPASSTRPPASCTRTTRRTSADTSHPMTQFTSCRRSTVGNQVNNPTDKVSHMGDAHGNRQT